MYSEHDSLYALQGLRMLDSRQRGCGFEPDMGRITLESNALKYHYLPKMCIELPLPLHDFVKVMH